MQLWRSTTHFEPRQRGAQTAGQDEQLTGDHTAPDRPSAPARIRVGRTLQQMEDSLRRRLSPG